MDFKNTLLIIIAIVNLLLGLFTYLKNRKSKINLTWSLSCSTVVFWTISMVLYRSADQVSSIFWCKILYISATLIPLTLLFFTFMFPLEKISLSKFQKFLIFFPNSIIILLIIWPGFIIKDVIWHLDREKEIIWGPGYPLYILYIIGYFSGPLINLLKKYQKSSGLLKLQLKYIFVGIACSVLFGTIFNLFMPSLGDFRFNWLGQIATIFYIFFVTAAITRYHLFEIRVILTELLVGAIGLILLVQIFTAPVLQWRVLNGVIFILFLAFGYYLIDATREEAKRREEAERLAIQERALRESAEKLTGEFKRLDEAKSQFMLATQHHLRTPLTAIQGYLSMLFEGSWGEINKVAKSKINAALESTQNLIRLVNEFLDLAKIEVGKEIMAKRETQLEDIFQEVINDLKPEAEKRRLYLKFEKPQFLPKIMTDPGKLKEAIYNVIFNGIKYTLKGGVTIQIKEKERKSVLIIIKDTGIGMKKEESESLFEKTFERGEEAKKVYTTGRGIGLYLSAQIIKAHQGKIWAESPGQGKGSTFYIELPLKEELEELLEKL